jgi:hypothetical protein
MSLLFLALVIAALWINLLGAGLAVQRWVRDYPIARAAGMLAVVLACFFLEHFAGWGPRPPLLPFTTAASIFLIWRGRSELRANWGTEALFGAGFFYCLAWRYAFPDIDFTGEKMPNLAMIVGYLQGTRLPAPDLWLSPYRLNFYYNFQHYAAALLGRLLGLGPGVTYHLAYCTVVGFITLLAGSAVGRLCAWTPGRWFGTLALIVGGSGAVVAAHFALSRVYVADSVRFVGGSMVHAERLNAFGARLAALMVTPGLDPRDLPMEPMSYVMTNGDYHPPLAGYLLLAFSAMLIAAQATGAAGPRRAVNHALLAATVPLALVANAWVFPLQFVLVEGWFVYRALCRERGLLLPALLGGATAAFLEYPYLVQFTQQTIASNAAIQVTQTADHTPVLGWLLTFWPVVGIMVLALFNRDRRTLTVFFLVIWTLELAGTEFLYNHDVYGGVWVRFNSTLKWWPWVYAGVLLTLGANNLGSRSKLCRYGTLLLLVPTLQFGFDLGVQFAKGKKPSKGQLSGYAWIKDPIVRDMIVELGSRPDGVTLESGLIMSNSASPAEALFAGKQSFLGWPWHETTWRGAFNEIHQRLMENDAFYGGKTADPLNWLLHNQVKYVIWLPTDNASIPSLHRTLIDALKTRYFWHPMYGDDTQRIPVGFWERVDPAPAPAAAGK